MIARASQLFLPTLRDDPADAEAVSHRLLVRGGYIRQVGAGVWTFMPLGWRVHRKIEQIVRAEMNAIGGQEMLMPVLTPVELWEATGRASIPELFHLQDRTGRRFILPMTHEETVTFHAREIQSYKQLPQLWYHFAVKDRDEPRPRGGLLRMREFIMKDAYSFDRDEEGVRRSFEANRDAYKRIFGRCDLETYDVRAESGIMGGKFSVDFLAPSGSGENMLVICENGDYAADHEVASAIPRKPEFPPSLDTPEEVETPGVTTIEGLAAFLAVVVADDTLREGQFVAGANRDGWHLRGVEASRDYEPRFADLREPVEGDHCPECGGALRFQTAIEVGHIFNFGSFYAKPLEATFLDEDGREQPLLGGSYGIGPARVLAAIVEQHHDEKGIVWPPSVSPYDAHVIALAGADSIAEAAAEILSAKGLEVLLDDRDQRAGEKFADADLIGIPRRITAGKKSLDDGAVDVRDRRTSEESRVNLEEL